MSTENSSETVVTPPAEAAPAAPAAAPERPAREGRGGGGGFRGPGGGRGPRRDGGRRDSRDKPQEGDGPSMIEKVVFINRCAKVVKGGRRFSFAAIAVVVDFPCVPHTAITSYGSLSAPSASK